MRILSTILACAALAIRIMAAQAADEPPAGRAKAVDTALVLAVDVSGSVDEKRYRLQLDGIADALDDPGVQRAMLGGGSVPMLITLVLWADRARVALPWTRLASPDDASAFAGRIRVLPRMSGDFTCLATMLSFVADRVLPAMPAPARQIVVDVSGDGSDNCNPKEPTPTRRDELVALGATINGLPIREGRETDTIEAWYIANVIGGEAAFSIPAEGYSDVGRAMRQKFLAEVSGLQPPLSRRAAAHDGAAMQ